MKAAATIYCSVETMEKLNQIAKEESSTKGKVLDKLVGSYELKKESVKSSKKSM